MDYAEMVSQIMAAEQGAKALTDEAREKRQQVQAGLEKEVSALREDYMDRARQRLEEVQRTETAAAEEAVQQLDQRLDRAMKAVEAAYQKNRDRWVDALFAMIVGVKPS